MNRRTLLNTVSSIFVAVAISACSQDSTAPASAADQAKMMRGSAPTKDQLATAMKNYKGLSGPPPAGGNPGPASNH